MRFTPNNKSGCIGSTRKGVNSAIAGALHADIDSTKEKRRETVVHRRMAELAINGYQQKEIAVALGVTPKTVSENLRQPYAREYMIQRMQQSANEEIKEALEKAAPGAIRRIIQLAEDAPNTKLGFAANLEVLDRFLGKAVQPMTHEVTDLDKLSTEELERIAASGQQSEALPRA